MMSKTVIGLAFAASCLTAMPLAMAAPADMAAPAEMNAPADQLVTNGPQADPGDQSANWSARQNVIESHRYDRMVETNRAFRAARMRKECGPINDPQLHASCMASFNQAEPMMSGSSMPRHRFRNSAGE